jgi:hypothetical protein
MAKGYFGSVVRLCNTPLFVFAFKTFKSLPATYSPTPNVKVVTLSIKIKKKYNTGTRKAHMTFT